MRRRRVAFLQRLRAAPPKRAISCPARDRMAASERIYSEGGDPRLGVRSQPE
jgi:hypothetical protein